MSDDLYEQELAALEQACKDFLAARTEQHHRTQDRRPVVQTMEERFLQLLIAGQITVGCAKVYTMGEGRVSAREPAAAEIRVLHSVPNLPACPHCGSSHVTRFNLDWIETPDGSWECKDCGKAFIPEAWAKS